MQFQLPIGCTHQERKISPAHNTQKSGEQNTHRFHHPAKTQKPTTYKANVLGLPVVDIITRLSKQRPSITLNFRAQVLNRPALSVALAVRNILSHAFESVFFFAVYWVVDRISTSFAVGGQSDQVPCASIQQYFPPPQHVEFKRQGAGKCVEFQRR